MPDNFGYVIPGKLAGSAEPGGFNKSLHEDLNYLKNENFTAIVTLTEFNLPEEILEEFCFDHLHLPIEDFGAPSLRDIDAIVNFINNQLANNGKVLVHCWAGRGRTGTVLACYLVTQGMTAKEAIEHIRVKRPGSIETGIQINAIKNYEQWLKEHNRFPSKKNSI